MLAKGVLSQRDYDQVMKMNREANEVNLGYAFLTFSHSDEAKVAMIMSENLWLDNIEVSVSMKNDNVDHKDFDFRYKIN